VGFVLLRFSIFRKNEKVRWAEDMDEAITRRVVGTLQQKFNLCASRLNWLKFSYEFKSKKEEK
jgi:uncharacterized protein YlxP (DUF503 family)